MRDSDGLDPGLHVLKGPMFARKTASLIDILKSFVSIHIHAEAFRPLRDTRDDTDHLVSHDGDKWPARRLADAWKILEISNAPAVVIDEANMWGKDLVPVCLRLVADDRRVYVAGLDLDHRGFPFPPMPDLLCYADTVVTLAASCSECGDSARFTQRLVASSDLIVPGGAESYAPRCATCFRPAK